MNRIEIHRISGRFFFRAVFLLLSFICSVPCAQAKVYLDINAPSARRMPIGVPEPVPIEGQQAVSSIEGEVRSVLLGDLDFSGVFRVLDPLLYLEEPGAGIRFGAFGFEDWELISAEALVKTGYHVRSDGDIELEFHLFDVFQRREVSARRWKGAPSQVRRMVHMFSNEIMKEVTGEKGVFLSRILYVQAEGKNKELFLMDYDGANVQRVTRSGSINMSPEWWPDGKGLIYTSFKSGDPALYSLNMGGGESRIVSGLGATVGAAFSPDGKTLAFTGNREGNPDIYLSDPAGKNARRITTLKSIETSPTWSPDGERIAFVSDRYGQPQIFVMNADGSGVRRVSLEGNYNTSPAWSPKGDLIAYTSRMGPNFGIVLVNPDTLESRPLVGEEGNNEDPCWSPDGRYIAFTSDRTGTYQIYLVDRSGRWETRVTSGSGDKTQPAWSWE